MGKTGLQKKDSHCGLSVVTVGETSITARLLGSLTIRPTSHVGIDKPSSSLV